MDKGIVAIVILLLAVALLVPVCSVGENPNSGNLTQLEVSSEGPIDLSVIIRDIKTGKYYEGYDNETLAWMESLANKQVFSGDGMIVVMDRTDASKLHSEYVCDAYITESMECRVLENHSLGDVKSPRDVLLVKDVRYLGEEIHYLQGS